MLSLPPSSPSSAHGPVLSPVLLIYLSFSLTLFAHTLLTISHTAAPTKIDTRTFNPQVEWADVPAVQPDVPEPLVPATTPSSMFETADIDSFTHPEENSNDSPTRCAKNYKRERCEYMTYDQFDDKGQGHRKNGQAQYVRDGEEYNDVIATLTGSGLSSA